MKIFKKLHKDYKDKAIENLIKQSRPDRDFFIMTILAVLMATFGLLINNSAVIIGSMLIAPLLYPILSLALGIVMADFKLISRALFTVIQASAFSIIAAAIVTLFFTSDSFQLTAEILSRTDTSIIYAIIAVIAGLAGSISLIIPDLNENLTGVAISAALIPPLANVGIGIAKLNWFIASKSFLLFIINIVGILFASTVVFSLMNLYMKREIAQNVIKEESKDNGKKEEA